MKSILSVSQATQGSLSSSVRFYSPVASSTSLSAWNLTAPLKDPAQVPVVLIHCFPGLCLISGLCAQTDVVV